MIIKIEEKLAKTVYLINCNSLSTTNNKISLKIRYVLFTTLTGTIRPTHPHRPKTNIGTWDRTGEDMPDINDISMHKTHESNNEHLLSASPTNHTPILSKDHVT